VPEAIRLTMVSKPAMTSRKTVENDLVAGPVRGAAVANERRHQIIAGLGSPGGDQLGEVRGQLALQALVLRAIVVGGDSDGDPRTVRLRDVEQLAEHRDRQGRAYAPSR
jgi:hypothetical protein